jgi:DNA-binding NtrC family response regulator
MELDVQKLTANKSPHGPQSSQGKTILLVEDDTVFLHGLRQVLSRLGHRVFTATNVSEAEETWAKVRKAIDLVVCDQKLGHDLGIDLVQRFKSHQPEIQIVLCSGGTAPTDIGGIRFLSKPFHISALFEAAA